MSHELKIADKLSLPIDAATQTFAFIARKGAGKTYAAGKLTELLLEAGVQVVVLDTVGNWYGLRIAADGKGKGFDIPVLGGLRGDRPLLATAGEVVADVAVDTGRSLVLDLSQFSLGERKRFATSFGERLWKKKKAEQRPRPLFLVIEESQLIVPQQVTGGGDTARMVGTYEEIVRLGRNYGIGCAMISQRPQSVNKEVLNQAECLFVLQVNGAQERKALRDWITHQGMDPKLLDELPSLPIGTAYVWSPQWLKVLTKVKIAPKKTLDASATPKVGDRTVRRDPAPLDLSELEAQMAATVEEAKKHDPRELRREVDRLRKELDLANSFAGKFYDAAGVEDDGELLAWIRSRGKAALDDGQLVRAETLAAELLQLDREYQAAREKHFGLILLAIKPIHDALGSRSAKEAALPPAPKPPIPTKTFPAGSRVVSGAPAATSSGLGEGHMRILRSLYWLKNEERTPAKVAFFADYTVNGHFTNLIGALRSRGLAQGWSITPDGEAMVPGDVQPKPTGRELREWMRSKLNEGENRILDALMEAGGARLGTEELAARSRFTVNGHFTNLLGHLRTISVAEGYAKDGGVKVADVFLEA